MQKYYLLEAIQLQIEVLQLKTPSVYLRNYIMHTGKDLNNNHSFRQVNVYIDIIQTNFNQYSSMYPLKKSLHTIQIVLFNNEPVSIVIVLLALPIPLTPFVWVSCQPNIRVFLNVNFSETVSAEKIKFCQILGTPGEKW